MADQYYSDGPSRPRSRGSRRQSFNDHRRTENRTPRTQTQPSIPSQSYAAPRPTVIYDPSQALVLRAGSRTETYPTYDHSTPTRESRRVSTTSPRSRRTSRSRSRGRRHEPRSCSVYIHLARSGRDPAMMTVKDVSVGVTEERLHQDDRDLRDSLALYLKSELENTCIDCWDYGTRNPLPNTDAGSSSRAAPDAVYAGVYNLIRDTINLIAESITRTRGCPELPGYQVKIDTSIDTDYSTQAGNFWAARSRELAALFNGFDKDSKREVRRPTTQPAGYYSDR